MSQGNKRVYHLWKKGQAAREVLKDIVRSCRKKIKEVKAQLEVNLSTSVIDHLSPL